MKDAVNEMFDKFQIIGMNLIQAKKFKKDAQHRIYHVEEKQKQLIDVHRFAKDMEAMEERIKDFAMGQNKVLQDDLNAHKQELSEKARYFDEKTSELQ